MEHIPDNYEFGVPIINYEDEPVKYCPVCRKPCEKIYFSTYYGEVIGCDECIKEKRDD
jgi:hypothetical protein